MTISKITDEALIGMGTAPLGWWSAYFSHGQWGDIKLVSGEWILEELLK